MTDATRHYVISTGTSQIGTATVRREGERITLESRVWNNGRGSHLHETIELGTGEVPRTWTISGTGQVGAAVEERFVARGDNSYEWAARTGTARHEAASDDPLTYNPVECGPFGSWVHLRSALARGGAVPCLPSGEVRARRVEGVDPGGLDTTLSDTVLYAVGGVTLEPRYVLMDPSGSPVAIASGDFEMAIEQDCQHLAPQLARLFDDAEQAELRAITARVAHRFDLPVRFANVRLYVPGEDRLSEPVSVTVWGERISAVQPESAVVPGEREIVVDGAGDTLIAGLHDMHAHVTARSGVFYLAAGITAVRDMGNDNDSLPGIVGAFASGALAGPTVVASGLIEGRSEFSVNLGFVAETLSEALGYVRWYAARGYLQIKLYNSIQPSWVPALTAEAHRLGMRAVGHVPAFATADDMIRAGYDEITHINQLMLGWLLEPGEDTRTPLRLTAMARASDFDLESPQVRATFELLRAHRAGVDTTAVAFERLMLSRDEITIESDRPVLDHLPIGYQRERRATFVPERTDDQLAAYDVAFARMIDVIGMLHEAGVPLWPGTDDGTGFTVHRELELYVQAGIPAAQALRIATADCAGHLGLAASRGSIERGKQASFALVAGDPTRDISAIRRVRATMQNGTLYFPDEIYPELGVVPFAERPRLCGTADD